MNRLLVYLGRLFLILLAYAMAAVAASAFIHLMWLGALGWTAEEAPWIALGSIVFSIPLVALFIAYFAFLPAVVAIGVGEVLGARDWLFYAIGGAVAATTVIALFWYSGPEPISFGDGSPLPEIRREPFDDPRFVMVIVGAGLVAGLIYWALAGRFAGFARLNRTSE
ncbi:MAG: hypothetical protein Q8Q62_11965 [Mesorhizobium sp.]|nr:hypothetical protein [Mesorhizobium sp.]